MKKLLIILLVSCATIDPNLLKKIDKDIKSHENLSNYSYEVVQTGNSFKVTGNVGNSYTKNAIEKIIEKHTKTDVESELEINSESNDIPTQVKNSLKKLNLAEYNIKVSTREGNVIIDGYCSDEVDENKIINEIYKIPNVKKVESKLTYKGITSDQELKDVVLIKLNELDQIDTSTLGVSVKDRVVTLTGTQKTRRDIDKILSNLQMITGIKEIKSKILVGNSEYMSPEYIKSNL